MKRENKFTRLLYDNRFVFLSAMCSAAIMLVVFMCYGMFPLGETTVLRMDLYHQYGPLFAELYDRVTSGGSFLYSFNTGLGSSFLGNYFNYLSSPIGFIVTLIAGHENMPEGIAAMVLLKSALSALTLTYYLKNSQKRSNYASAGFGVLYSFCGWFIAYYWNIMWIDAMLLLPLVALGIEKIINNGKPVLYITALSLTMLSNYYMSYMMCIFSVIYFLTYFISNYSLNSKLPYAKEKRSGKIKSYNRFMRSGTIFALASLCAGGLIAFALIPTFLTLQQTSATSGTFPKTSSFYFTIFDFICNHLASVTPTIRSSGDDVLPNVYCGLLTLMLVPLYLMTKSISKKEKSAHLIVLFIFMIGFNYNVLNYIWHGLHFPNDLPYRQSFMYSFIIVLIAYKTFTRLNEIPNRYILFSGIAVICLTVLGQKLNSKNLTETAVIISIIFAAIYVLILVTLKDKKFQTVSVSVLLLCCICSEAIIADTQNYSIDQKKSNYAGDYQAFCQVKDYLDEINEEPFYRMELTRLRARMDPSWYNYNGVSTFSSMAYEKLSNFQKSLGMYSNKINSYTYYPQTAVYNAMFSLKYLVNNTADFNVLADSDQMTQLYQNDIFTAYKNEKYLPIGYCVDTSICNLDTTSSDPFDVQNSLFEKATGISDVLVRTFPTDIAYTNVAPFTQPLTNQIFSYKRNDSSTSGKVTFDFVAQSNSEVYIYAQTTDSEGEIMTVTTSTQIITETLNKNYSYILNIGQLSEGENFSCTVPVNSDSGTIYFYVCYLDNEAFNEGFEKLKAGAIIYDEFTDTDIKGTFYAHDTGVFMTSIPYDKGWSVYIDGQKANSNDIVKIADSLLGVYITEGYHEVELKFIPQGLYSGGIISLVTLAICLLLIIVNLIRKRIGASISCFDSFDKSYETQIFMPPLIKAKESYAEAERSLPQVEIIEPYEISEDEPEGIDDKIDDEELRDFFSQD